MFNMKKLLFLFLIIIALINVYSADYPNLPGIKTIIDRGYIKAGICESDTPPFFYKDSDNKYQGMDIDILKDVCEKLGVKYKLILSPSFDKVVDNLVDNNTDIAISNLSITLERAKKVYFTKPYIKLKMGLFIDHRYTESFENKDGSINLETKNIKIGVLSNSSYEFFARQLFTKATIIPFDSWEEVVNKILAGEIQAGFYDEVALERTMRLNPTISIKLKKVLIDVRKDPIAIAVSPDNADLLQWLDHYLETTQIKPLNYYFDRFFAQSEIAVVPKEKKSFTDIFKDNYIISIFGILILIGIIFYFYKKSKNFLNSVFNLMLNPYVVILAMILGI